MLRSKINQKKLNENFSSIDPQGQESKAHRLWKWLMDNGSKTREEIYAFDRSYSTVLAKYWRNGLVTLNGGLYSAVPNYKFVDVRQIEDKNSELERIFQNYKSVKYRDMENSVKKFNEYVEKATEYKNLCDSFKNKLKAIKQKINGCIRIANTIDKGNSPKVYDMRGVRNSVHPSKYFADRFRYDIGDIDYVMGHPKDSAGNLRSMIYDFGTSIPNELNDIIEKTKDSLNFYKTNPDASNPEYNARVREELIRTYEKLKSNSLSLCELVKPLLNDYNEISDSYPGFMPPRPPDEIRRIPKELFDDYKKLVQNPEYDDKIQNLIFRELMNKAEELCPKGFDYSFYV